MTDLLTKLLPTSSFEKLRYNIGMRRLKNLLHHKCQNCEMFYSTGHYDIFSSSRFLFHWVFACKIITRQFICVIGHIDNQGRML